MIKKILIANRGEIACRIIRTCKLMGIKTLVIYSEADKKSLHVRESDKAVFIGESPADKSYLNYKKIVQVAIENKVDAVHPGYGFGFDEDYKQFPCKCGSKNCCGYIVRAESRWRISKKFAMSNKKKLINNSR